MDYTKKRYLRRHPYVSFLIPCYNACATIEQTIESIVNSYPKNKSEIIVINDASKDDSSELLKKLHEKYGIKILNNKMNLGKSTSLNNAAKIAKHDIFLFIDSDVLVTKKVIYDILIRMQEKNVAGVSAPYNAINKGLFAAMQNMEHNLFSFMQTASNKTSAISLQGGCFAVKREAFEKVGGLSKNMLTEDIDLALRLNEANYRVEQSFIPFKTYDASTFKSWVKQRVRWVSGAMVCLLKYFKLWLKHPIYLLFTLLFSFLSLYFIISLIRNIIFFNTVWDYYNLLNDTVTNSLSLKLTGAYYGLEILRRLSLSFYFILFSIPYTFSMIDNWKQSYRILYAIPFALFYYPAFVILAIFGMLKGVKDYFLISQQERGW
jgi:cellulose synthase/poly-beta-1,6-N-acetylglucosamine synthase-like glycosyltransferase